MERNISRFSRAVARFLSSPAAWWVVVGLLVLESLWLVFSAKYPMAFDENYHFGLIRLHAQQWLPFFTAQPPESSAYGAIARDPSYLYHWLLSFPYRLVSIWTDSQVVHIIALRLINVGLFVGGMFVYRRLILKLGASRALTTSVLALVALIPIVPFLAATINYDNLFFVTVGLTLLIALRLHEGYVRHVIDARWSLGLVSLGLFASLVKYPFLPVLVTTLIFLVWQIWRTGLLSQTGWLSFWQSFKALPRWTAVALSVLCIIAAGLFAERYIPNLVRYHNPVPGCSEVLTNDECMQYGPYNRDKLLADAKPDMFAPSHAWYIQQWLYGMWLRLFFAVNHEYRSAEPLPIISRTGIAIAVLFAAGIIIRAKQLISSNTARLFVMGTILVYVAILFAQGWAAYVKTTQPVAINGRYLIPFLPLLLALGGLAWSQLLRRAPAVKSVAAVVVLGVFLLQGGGTMTFIIRSADDWMWGNTQVQYVNRTVRSLAWPYIVK